MLLLWWSPTSSGLWTTRVISKWPPRPLSAPLPAPESMSTHGVSSLVVDQRCRTAPAPRQARHPPPSAGRSYDAEQIRRALSLLMSPAPSPSHPRQSLGPRATALGLQLPPPLQGLFCQLGQAIYRSPRLAIQVSAHPSCWCHALIEYITRDSPHHRPPTHHPPSDILITYRCKLGPYAVFPTRTVHHNQPQTRQ